MLVLCVHPLVSSMLSGYCFRLVPENCHTEEGDAFFTLFITADQVTVDSEIIIFNKITVCLLY